VTGKSRQQPRHAIWLGQETLVAAQRLSEATGLSVQELIEIALFGVLPEELRLVRPAGTVPAKAASRAPRSRRSPAQVIPIGRARRVATPPEQQRSHFAERADPAPCSRRVENVRRDSNEPAVGRWRPR
jgi:hypothetical protein